MNKIIDVEDFNEMVFDYGANGDNSREWENLNDEQKEVIAMAWSRSDMDDDEINSYYPDFLKASK